MAPSVSCASAAIVRSSMALEFFCIVGIVGLAVRTEAVVPASIAPTDRRFLTVGSSCLLMMTIAYEEERPGSVCDCPPCSSSGLQRGKNSVCVCVFAPLRAVTSCFRAALPRLAAAAAAATLYPRADAHVMLCYASEDTQ